MKNHGLYFNLSARELILIVGFIIGALTLLNTRASDADLNRLGESVLECKKDVLYIKEEQTEIELKLDAIHDDIKELLQRASALEAGAGTK